MPIEKPSKDFRTIGLTRQTTMASFTKSGLQRVLIIAYVVLVTASVIGRSVGDGVLDEAFWIKTLIGYAIAIVFVGAVVLLLKKGLRSESALNQSVVQQPQSINQSKNNCCNEVEDGIYEVVADEISTGSIQKAAWTQAFSEADGNDARAKAFYIKIRVRQLKRDAERNTQDRPPEEESVTDRVRLLLEKLGQIPYEDTERISRDDFRGSRSSLLEPISVATASSVSGLLAFQVIDLIKRGFIDGVRCNGFLDQHLVIFWGELGGFELGWSSVFQG